MPPLRVESFRRPSAGLRSGTRPHLLQMDQWAELRNLWIRGDALVKRGGSVAQGDALAAATVRWLAHAYSDNTTTALKVRMALCGTALKAQVSDLGAWTDFATGLTAGTYPVSASYKDQVWWCDGVNTPLKITIANPPVDSSWGGLPSGINPRWVVLHKNRLYYGGDITTPTYVYMTNPGTPETTTVTDLYQVPDDQRGFYPRIAANLGDGIGLYAQDYLCYMTGTGPLSHRIYHLPKGAACLYWRTVVDMGGWNIFLTERGPFAWDGHTVAEPLDPYEEVNWGDIDYTNIEDTWAIRYGDLYILAYRGKGQVTTAATGTARQRGSVYLNASYAINTVLTGGGAVAPAADSNTSRCVVYDSRTKHWSGPHNFPYACGAWEEALHGDTQDLWVGSATTGGKVLKWDQQTYTDDGADYDCVAITGALGDSMMRTLIERVKVMTRVRDDAKAKLHVAVYQNGVLHLPPLWEDAISLTRSDAMGGDASKYNLAPSRENLIVKIAKPRAGLSGEVGYQPQIMFRYSGPEAFVLDAYEAEAKTVGE